MALQVRRGTNAERLGITPLAGELVYTTDTKQLYVGDGATAGGITSIAGTIDSLLADTTPQLGGTLDLNGNNITGTGNINITGTITASGNINLGDGIGSDIVVFGGAIQGHLVPDTDITWNLGSSTKQFNEAWIGQLNVENQLTVGRIMGDLIADDSTVVFDSSTGLFVGDLTGNVLGNLTGNVLGNLTGDAAGDHTGTFVGASSGTFDGDMTGSIFTDSSTLIVNGQTGDIHTGKIIADASSIIVQKTGVSEPFEFNVIGKGNTTGIRIVTQSDSNLTGTFYSGKLWFGYKDPTGSDVTSGVLGGEDSVYIVSNASSDFSAEASYLTWQAPGKLGVGTYTPVEELDVRGNAIVTGFVQFGSLTTTERNALTAAAGMVIWNSTTTQFEGFNGTNWINLVDGVVSA
jgi:hypothetical protein